MKRFSFAILCLALALAVFFYSNNTKTRITLQTVRTQLEPKPIPAPATTTVLGTNSPEQAKILEPSAVSTKIGISQQTGAVQLAPRPDPALAKTTAPRANTPEQAKLLEAWRISMAQVPLPKKGTFEATYPNKEWHEVPSAKAPPYPMFPRLGPSPQTVGNSNEVSAKAPSGLISSARGSFDSVTGVTSESGQINGTGSAVTDAYSLQLNTNFFPSTVGGSAGCQGWEQFLYSNDGASGTYHSAYIQYWLIGYGATSPGTGWINGGANAPNSWYRNSTNASAVPNQPISNLANLSLGGTVSGSGDSYFFSAGNSVYAGTGDNLVNAAAGWNAAEFIVCGDAGGGQANFNNGSAMVTRTQITYGGVAAPLPVVAGWTAETNNLNFGPNAPSAPGPGDGPALLVTLSTAGSTTASSAVATGVAETYWVDFNTGQDPPSGNGTYNYPVRTLAEGVNGAPAGGNVWIRTAGSSSEAVPLTISKPLKINAYNGPATVGQ